MGQETAYPRTDTTSLVSDKLLEESLRRTQLAGFLRARRAAILPSALGLPNTSRRRVKGLRREEVAEAAGISVAWYTWIEQARNIHLSEHTLDQLSRALQLNRQERRHLFQLAGHAEPLPQPGPAENVLSSVQNMINSMEPNPTYALSPIWDIVAWNNAASNVIFDFDSIPEQERNFVRLIFTNKAIQQRFTNWEEVAHCTLGNFRIDSVAHIADIRWLRLIDDLTASSAEFRQWWPRHNVAWPHSWKKELNHPGLGRVAYNTLDLELHSPARLRIVTYIPS